tara:strand:- start:106 stop:492 length:387 start_codon:yes stop_codon:yes gene_type:complete
VKNKEGRPVNLNIFKINLPITGVISILHRIAGFSVFVCFLFVVWLLDQSLSSEETFLNLSSNLKNPSAIKLFTNLILVGFIFHSIIGLKKMMSEFFGLGEKPESATRVSILTFIVIISLSIYFVVYFW